MTKDKLQKSSKFQAPYIWPFSELELFWSLSFVFWSFFADAKKRPACVLVHTGR